MVQAVEECRLGSIRRVGVQTDYFRCSARRDANERRRGGSERRRRGTGQSGDYGAPDAAAAAPAAAAAAGSSSPTVKVRGIRLLGLRGGVRSVLGAGVSVPGSCARTV